MGMWMVFGGRSKGIRGKREILEDEG